MRRGGGGRARKPDPHGDRAQPDPGWSADSTGTFYGKPMTAGDIYTVAGGGGRILGDGPATEAKLDPVERGASAAGRLLVTDNADSRIRAIAP